MQSCNSPVCYNDKRHTVMNSKKKKSYDNLNDQQKQKMGIPYLLNDQQRRQQNDQITLHSTSSERTYDYHSYTSRPSAINPSYPCSNQSYTTNPPLTNPSARSLAVCNQTIPAHYQTSSVPNNMTIYNIQNPNLYIAGPNSDNVYQQDPASSSPPPSAYYNPLSQYHIAGPSDQISMASTVLPHKRSYSTGLVAKPSKSHVIGPNTADSKEDRKRRLQLALENLNNGVFKNIHSAASAYDVNYNSLKNAYYKINGKDENRQRLTTSEREKRIKKAIEGFRDGKYSNLTEASKFEKVCAETVRNRYHGRTQSFSEAKKSNK